MMQSVPFSVWAAAVSLMLGGCAMQPVEEPRFQQEIPEGSTLVLDRSLEVPPGAHRVYMQDGRIVEPRLINLGSRFRPRCWFRLTGRPGEASATTIEPDRFRTGAMRTRAHARYDDDPGVQVASRSPGALRLAGDAGGVGFLTHIVEIPLSSSDQPRVKRLACEVDRRTGMHRTLGLHAIRQATGDIVRIEMAD